MCKIQLPLELTTVMEYALIKCGFVGSAQLVSREETKGGSPREVSSVRAGRSGP